LANPFRVVSPWTIDPRVVAVLQPWAEVSERLRRILRNPKLTRYLEIVRRRYETVSCCRMVDGDAVRRGRRNH
jgi:hypothetical protein